MAFAFCASTAPYGLDGPAGKFGLGLAASPASPYWKMWTAVWLSRLSNLYAAVMFNGFFGLAVSLTLNASLTTRPFRELTGTTTVVLSVRNGSFCVLRAYDPFATSFVVAEKFTPPVAVTWLNELPGALLIVLSVPGARSGRSPSSATTSTGRCS